MAALAINDIQAFPGVQVEELQAVLSRSGHRREGRMGRCGRQKTTRAQADRDTLQ
jgi:hypothetical protein